MHLVRHVPLQIQLLVHNINSTLSIIICGRPLYIGQYYFSEWRHNSHVSLIKQLLMSCFFDGLIRFVLPFTISKLNMLAKTAEIVLNSLGILNFQYNAKKKVIEVNNWALVVSVLVFLLLQGNVFLVYKTIYFDPHAGSHQFIDLVSVVNLISWAIMNVTLFMEKVLCRHQYIRLMGRILSADNHCSRAKKMNIIWKRKCIQFTLGLILYATFYVPMKYNDFKSQSLLLTIRDMVYACTFTFSLLLNSFVEMGFFYKVKLSLQFVNSNFKKKRFGHRELYKLFGVNFKFVGIMDELERTFSLAKIVHIVFLYISFPAYFFYLYFAFYTRGSLLSVMLFYWMLELLIFLLCSTAWSFPSDEVSIFIFITKIS